MITKKLTKRILINRFKLIFFKNGIIYPPDCQKHETAFTECVDIVMDELCLYWVKIDTLNHPALNRELYFYATNTKSVVRGRKFDELTFRSWNGLVYPSGIVSHYQYLIEPLAPTN